MSLGGSWETAQFAFGAGVAACGGQPLSAFWAMAMGRPYLNEENMSPYLAAGLGLADERTLSFFAAGSEGGGGAGKLEAGFEFFRLAHTHVDLSFMVLLPFFQVNPQSACSPFAGCAPVVGGPTYDPLFLGAVQFPF